MATEPLSGRARPDPVAAEAGQAGGRCAVVLAALQGVSACHPRCRSAAGSGAACPQPTAAGSHRAASRCTPQRWPGTARRARPRRARGWRPGVRDRRRWHGGGRRQVGWFAGTTGDAPGHVEGASRRTNRDTPTGGSRPGPEWGPQRSVPQWWAIPTHVHRLHRNDRLDPYRARSALQTMPGRSWHQ
jgi:hypothetical protein